MNREIEFRAFDENIMHYDVSLVDGMAYKRGCIGNIFAKNSEAGTPMQYTGLKDKNNDKIYEGDIIKNHLSYGKIIYQNDRFVIDWFVDRDFWSDSLKDHHENSHILGNIYEHKHLLEYAGFKAK